MNTQPGSQRPHETRTASMNLVEEYFFTQHKGTFRGQPILIMTRPRCISLVVALPVRHGAVHFIPSHNDENSVTRIAPIPPTTSEVEANAAEDRGRRKSPGIHGCTRSDLRTRLLSKPGHPRSIHALRWDTDETPNGRYTMDTTTRNRYYDKATGITYTCKATRCTIPQCAAMRSAACVCTTLAYAGHYARNLSWPALHRPTWSADRCGAQRYAVGITH